jgi:hypothetical protein
MLSAGKWWAAGMGVIVAMALLAAAMRPTEQPKQPAAPPPVGPTAPVTAGQPSDPPKKPTVDELRKKYPFESITGRLDYEPAGAEAFAKSDPPPKATDATLKRLAGHEQGIDFQNRWGQRVESLKRLHSSEAQKFIDRDGFGISRMPTPSYMLLDLPDAPTIPFVSVRDGDKEPATSPKEAAKPPKDDELAGFNQAGISNFLDPNSFGYVKDREHVAGFRPHQFRGMPTLPAGKTEQWAVIRLELVSLLKHDAPCAYVTNALPRMEDAKNAPTRPLIPFEEKGLKALKAGDDLATESSGDSIRMLGSLRAGKQCLECHEVKRGDLLGAFSWELQRQPAPPQNQPIP